MDLRNGPLRLPEILLASLQPRIKVVSSIYSNRFLIIGSPMSTAVRCSIMKLILLIDWLIYKACAFYSIRKTPWFDHDGHNSSCMEFCKLIWLVITGYIYLALRSPFLSNFFFSDNIISLDIYFEDLSYDEIEQIPVFETWTLVCK